MVETTLSLEKMEGGALDLKTIETYASGDENVVNEPRLAPGVNVGSLAALNKHVKDKVALQIATLPSGRKGYATLASAQAAQASLPANTIIEVNNDSDSTKNGVYTWDGTALVKSNNDVLGQAKAYADSNPFFKPKSLSKNQDLNTLFDGIYRSLSNTVGNTLLNLPSDIGTNKIFTLICYRDTSGVAYQKIILYTHVPTKDTVSWERTGNGGSSSFAWYDWVRVVNRTEFTVINSNLSSSITTLQDIKAEVNIFPNLSLDSSNTNIYQATLANENGYPTVTMNTTGVTAIFYDAITNTSLAVGNTVTFTAEGYSDDIGTNSGDITIQALTSSGTILATSMQSQITVANTWQKLSTSLAIPENTAKIRFRFISRNGTGNTVCKFRNPTAYTNYILEKYINPNQQTSVGNPIYYVAKTGSDTNNGSKNKPFLTIQKAVNSIGNSSGSITILDSEWYRETVNVSSDGNVTIQSARDKRAKIVGSDKLVLTKSNGYTKVYQASLAAKPTGMGGARGKPMIAEWGTPSSLITPEDIHHLQRGEAYRLPYTEMYETTSIANVETNNGTWFWEDGVIYLSATDGSDASLKQYEARVRTALSHSGGKLSLYRVDLMFSNSYGFYSTGIAVYREDCRAYSNHHNGFADYANSTVAYRDIALKNGNDGINGTVSSYDTENLTTAVQATYFDPYSALNGDDGISYHIRGTCNIYGGLFEYNTKAGVVHVTGGGGNCYNTIARGQNFGFYTATAPLDGRNKSSMHCHGTISEKNGNNYCAGSDGAELYCINTISVDPINWGYYTAGGKIHAFDAKLIGDAAKAKSGDIIINNTQLLS